MNILIEYGILPYSILLEFDALSGGGSWVLHKTVTFVTTYNTYAYIRNYYNGSSKLAKLSFSQTSFRFYSTTSNINSLNILSGFIPPISDLYLGEAYSDYNTSGQSDVCNLTTAGSMNKPSTCSDGASGFDIKQNDFLYGYSG